MTPPDEQLQQLPEQDVVFERVPFDAQDHDWRQIGYNLHCDGRNCNQPFAHGSSIPPGTLLVGKRGEWQLVREGAHAVQQ